MCVQCMYGEYVQFHKTIFHWLSKPVSLHMRLSIKYMQVYNTIPAITDNSYSHKLPHGDRLSDYTNQADAT